MTCRVVQLQRERIDVVRPLLAGEIISTLRFESVGGELAELRLVRDDVWTRYEEAQRRLEQLTAEIAALPPAWFQGVVRTGGDREGTPYIVVDGPDLPRTFAAGAVSMDTPCGAEYWDHGDLRDYGKQQFAENLARVTSEKILGHSAQADGADR